MKKVFKGIAIFVVLFFGFFLYATTNNIAGLRSFIVKSGSMEPSIPTGSLVVTSYTHPTVLQKNDVITFIRPSEERDFITHRITGIKEHDGFINIYTKGDNNKTADNWEVAGGSVVGKVNYTIPYLGYLFSFIQSKLGILLFILIPAIYIIVEETASVINLIKNRKTAGYAPKPIESAVLVFAVLIGLSAYSVSPTKALLTDTAQLTNNNFTVSLAPTAVPSPSSCGGNTVINVSGNGAGSNANVSVSNNCKTSINQSNTSTVINSITSTSTTGNNKSIFNSVSTNIIETGSTSSTISANTQGSSNTINIFSD